METIIFFVVLSSFFLGGVSFSTESVKFLGLFTSVVLLIFVYFKKKKIGFPKEVVFYELFLITLFLYQVIGKLSVYSFDYIILFLAGGLFWVAFYNLQEYRKMFVYLICFLGFVFLIMNFYHIIFSSGNYYYWNLAYPSTLNHNNIGDYWVLVVLISLFYLIDKFNKFFLILFSFSLIVVFLSDSRSALLAVIVGSFFLLKKKLKNRIIFENLRKYLYLFISLVGLIFIYQGSLKTTLNSRVYFLQAFYSIYKNPWGIGVGNFGIISQSLSKLVPGVDSYSLFTHNVVLELVVGLGIMSVFFVAWLILVFMNLLKDRKSDLIFTSLFIGITVVFLFDAVYFIPTMLWFWFCFLGFAERNYGSS